MEGTSGHILRNEDVILEGQYHLDAGQSGIDRNEPQQKNAVSASTQACILEDHPEYAVLEVTCACGTKICLRCEYASTKTPNNVQTQDSAAAQSDPMN
ncbi:hypothetical protein ACFL5Z_01490 [Planctomycetota bacterium]